MPGGRGHEKEGSGETNKEKSTLTCSFNNDEPVFKYFSVFFKCLREATFKNTPGWLFLNIKN